MNGGLAESGKAAFPIKEADPARCVEKLKAAGETRAFPKGAIVAHPGDSAPSCFLVLEGSVEAYTYTPAGAENVFMIHDAGYFFLEPQCLGEIPVMVYFRATEATVLLELPRDRLLFAMEEDFELAEYFIGILCEKFTWAIRHATDIATHGAMWRLCDLLVNLMNAHGEEQSDGSVVIRKRISQQTLSNMLHVNRVTVVRLIKDLKEAGILDSAHGTVRVFDREKLIRFRDRKDTYTPVIVADLGNGKTTTKAALTYTTSNAKIAKVDDAGVITAAKAGKATITATAPNGTKTTITVTASAKAVKLTKAAFTKKTLSVSAGKTAQLKLKLTPANATNITKVTYSSSNKKVLTVDKAGKITALKKGTATVKAKVGGKTATIKVTVK
ncbi:MAG: Ig-like domain-containing protein [Clostridiales Family XIII bacterium]|nr:Ig-like domain-containing protein [Clostridiales Family XIII bacterium]